MVHAAWSMPKKTVNRRKMNVRFAHTASIVIQLKAAILVNINLIADRSVAMDFQQTLDSTDQCACKSDTSCVWGFCFRQVAFCCRFPPSRQNHTLIQYEAQSVPLVDISQLRLHKVVLLNWSFFFSLNAIDALKLLLLTW